MNLRWLKSLELCDDQLKLPEEVSVLLIRSGCEVGGRTDDGDQLTGYGRKIITNISTGSNRNDMSLQS